MSQQPIRSFPVAPIGSGSSPYRPPPRGGGGIGGGGGPGGGHGPSDPNKLNQLNVCGTLLMVLSIIGLLVILAVTIKTFVSPSRPLPRDTAGLIGYCIGASLPLVCCLLTTIVTVIGARAMMQRSSYAAAMTAAIFNVIPCLAVCYLLGIPLGIWALILLRDPTVKPAFGR